MVGVVVTALLGLVALASRNGGLSAGGESESRQVPQAAVDFAFTVTTIVGLVLSLALLVLLFIGRVPLMVGTARVQRLLGGLIVLMLFAVAASRFTDYRWTGIPGRDSPVVPTGGAPRRDVGPRLERPRERPEFRWSVVVVLGALAAVGGGYLFVRRRRAGREPSNATLADELGGALDDALGDLEDERDPRRAVIVAYARMEDVLADHGFPRRAFEAPFEYLARIVRELQVRAEAALALTELFERAKFSRHEIDPAMRQEAIEALASVRDDLRAAA